jgi:nitrite reductase/ring-hydroxylating ferredoxin subunit
MVSGEDWVDVGSTDGFARTPLKSCKARAIPIAISFKDGQFGAVSNICNHVGGPLGRRDQSGLHASDRRGIPAALEYDGCSVSG